jgi:hypothetical protein
LRARAPARSVGCAAAAISTPPSSHDAGFKMVIFIPEAFEAGLNELIAESDWRTALTPDLTLRTQFSYISDETYPSSGLTNVELLEKQFEEASEKFGETPPRPAHWGGYRLKPDLLEFWQGRRSRLHDRVLYTLDTNGNWQRSRLQP